MTTLTTKQLTCPACSWEFSTQTVLSTNAFGGKRTDFHERAAGAQPVQYFVQACPNCHYAGAQDDFTGERAREHAEDALRSNWLRHRTIRIMEGIPGTAIPGAIKWELAALCALAAGYSLQTVADRYLRASWCCVDDGDIEAERYYRVHAARSFAMVLAEFDTIERDQRAVITYLVGELWRRIGDLKQAREWFDKVESEVIDPETQQWVVAAAIQQRDCPREWFG